VAGEPGDLSWTPDVRVVSAAAGPPKVAARPEGDLLFKLVKSNLF